MFDDTIGPMSFDIDYTRLFGIAKGLISTDIDKNTEALNDFDSMTGTSLGSQALIWYEAIKLTWNAAKSITHKIRSRDIQVNACVSLYFAQEIYE
jgi:hypothetical protein